MFHINGGKQGRELVSVFIVSVGSTKPDTKKVLPSSAQW